MPAGQYYDQNRPFIDQMAMKGAQPYGGFAGPPGPGRGVGTRPGVNEIANQAPRPGANMGPRPGANQALVDYIRKRKVRLVGGGGGPVGQVGGRPFGGGSSTAPSGERGTTGGNMAGAGGAGGAGSYTGATTSPTGYTQGWGSTPQQADIAMQNQIQRNKQAAYQPGAGGARTNLYG